MNFSISLWNKSTSEEIKMSTTQLPRGRKGRIIEKLRKITQTDGKVRKKEWMKGKKCKPKNNRFNKYEVLFYFSFKKFAHEHTENTLFIWIALYQLIHTNFIHTQCTANEISPLINIPSRNEKKFIWMNPSTIYHHQLHRKVLMQTINKIQIIIMIESPDDSGDRHIHRKYGNFVIFVHRRNGVFV